MANKRIAKFLAVSCLLACGLSACDDIEAKPSVNNDSAKLLDFIDNVYGNTYESINDGYHSEVAAKALDDVLYTYAIDVVGAYDAKIAQTYANKVSVNGVKAEGIVTLAEAATDDNKLTEFVKAHKAYNCDGNVANQKKFVKARYAAMQKAVAKKMYEKISSATEDNKFDERKLLVSLYDETQKVKNPYTLAPTDALTNDIVTPDKKPENVFTDGILHKDYYTDYIDDEIMPDIYRDALVQQYIFDEQEKTLGSSSARKINYISINYDGLDESLYAKKLINTFTKEYLIKENNESANVLDAFNLLSRTWNGQFMDNTDANIVASDEWKLLKTAGLVDANTVTGEIIDNKNGKSFIKGSAYGDLVEDYAKLNNNPAKSTASRDYTGGNKYVKEIGFELESNKIKLNDHVTDGWFIKSSSEISSLPDAIKSRLFNLSVATGKNNGTAATISKTAGAITVDSKGNKYIAKTGANYFLRNSNLKANQEDYESIIFNDSSSHTYYIINIEDAVSANFMNSDATKASDNYYALRIDVASLLSSNDTNITPSKKHWIEKCDIKYHDQSVYDYFKSNFPDLFEDD